MTDDFCGIKVDEYDEVYIRAIIPKRLSDIIKEKAKEKGISFVLMAGRYLVLGVESQLGQKHNACGKVPALEFKG